MSGGKTGLSLLMTTAQCGESAEAPGDSRISESGGKTGLSLLMTTARMWRVGRGPREQQNLGVRRQDWIVIADDYCSDVESWPRPLETEESRCQVARLDCHC